MALAGTSTPLGAVAASCFACCSRNDTRTPISGTTRGSFFSSATRTLMVALPRSAVGTMAMTWAGIFQSG
ncbi:hypothetical protein RLIN73S_05868 [Rhodanobacter lindaniclasticus]